jgi:hypothetical protein
MHQVLTILVVSASRFQSSYDRQVRQMIDLVAHEGRKIVDGLYALQVLEMRIDLDW